tara:strand:- start:2790 stop:2921 length:132 start_codon:yes stop_codon:yes gene_type:complete
MFQISSNSSGDGVDVARRFGGYTAFGEAARFLGRIHFYGQKVH